MLVHLFEKYGEMKPGDYNCVKENYDHLVVRWHGTNYCVPKNLFTQDDRIYEQISEDI